TADRGRTADVLLAAGRRPLEPLRAVCVDASRPRRAVCARPRRAGAARSAAGLVRAGLSHQPPHHSPFMTLRVGIVGFGGSGQAHLFYWSCVAGCRVTKIFDPKPAAASRAAARAPQVEFFPELDAFWRDLDAVVICTPDSTHADYIVAALKHGLHVLVEKPLTDTRTAGCAIRRATAAAPEPVVAVLHQMRFVPLHARIKALSASGALGRLSCLEG